MRTALSALLIVAVLLPAAACAPKFKLFSDGSDPLREQVLEGEGAGKVLVIPITGVITDEPREGLVSSRPGTVQEVAAQLRLAEKDKDIKALVLKIDSPGGGATASDILYHEVTAYRERTGVKVVAALMDMATSGGYYAAIAADRIVAHPTCVTGSVGVIFMRPKLYGLMDKIGVGMEVSKSGENKDMASPFRPTTDKEKALIDAMIRDLADRFVGLVRERRSLSPAVAAKVAEAAVYPAPEAKTLGLVDEIGYLSDALARAKEMTGLPEDATVVAYRRDEVANDTVYTAHAAQNATGLALINLNPSWLLPPRAGFHYLWLPAGE